MAGNELKPTYFRTFFGFRFWLKVEMGIPFLIIDITRAYPLFGFALIWFFAVLFLNSFTEDKFLREGNSFGVCFCLSLGSHFVLLNRLNAYHMMGGFLSNLNWIQAAMIVFGVCAIGRGATYWIDHHLCAPSNQPLIAVRFKKAKKDHSHPTT